MIILDLYMKTHEPEIVELTDRERDWLMEVYEMRRKNLIFRGFFYCLLSCAAYLIMICFFVAFFHDIFSSQSRWLSQSFLYPIKILLLLSLPLSVIICFIGYRTRVLTFKLDALSGKKYSKAYTVHLKEFFPTTGQYFVRINDGLDKRYEIDESSFNNCEEGGVIHLGQAIQSGYIFTESNNLSVKLFQIKRGGRFDYKV